MTTYLQMIKKFNPINTEPWSRPASVCRKPVSETDTRLIIMQNKQDADFQNIVGLGALRLAINEFRDYHLKPPLNFYSSRYL